ncbi:surfeit locus protein 2 [Petromyzon marinus]|uniref:surfeit locus protein 2 n=1 Tax=Petromyzon marinus TaxID=7757 RepID=UPI003F6F73A0
MVLCSLTSHEMPPRAEELSRHVRSRSFVRRRAARGDRDRDREEGGHLDDAGRKRLFCHLTQRFINQDQISQHKAGRRYRIALQRYCASVESGVPFTPLARRARGRGRGRGGRGRGGGGVAAVEEVEPEEEEEELKEEELQADSDSDLYPPEVFGVRSSSAGEEVESHGQRAGPVKRSKQRGGARQARQKKHKSL